VILSQWLYVREGVGGGGRGGWSVHEAFGGCCVVDVLNLRYIAVPLDGKSRILKILITQWSKDGLYFH